MANIHAMTFQRKLFLFAALTSGSGLVIAATATLLSAWRDLHAKTLSQVTVQTDIIAANLSAAISFDDSNSATETLAAFRADTNVSAALVCKANGTPIAFYPTPSSGKSVLVCGEHAGHTYCEKHLDMVRSIIFNNEVLGTVMVRYELDVLYDQMLWQLAISVLVVCAALLAALFIASQVRTLLLRPVSELADAAQTIARTGSYGTRVNKHANDELGNLADAFNLMVGCVQNRNAELQRYHVELEERVRERTAALRESETRFRELADAAPMMVWLAGADKGCTDFNKGWLDFRGRTVAEEKGDGWVEGVHPDDLSRCLETYVTAFDARLPFSMSYRLRRHDGVYRWIEDKGVPRYAADGAFLGYVGGCMDVTEKQEAEQRLAASEMRIRSIIDTALDAVISIDTAGMVIDWNQQAEAIFGWTVSEAIGRPLHELIIPDELGAAHRSGLARYEIERTSHVLGKRIEICGVRKDRSRLTVELAINAIESSTGPFFSAFLCDITARKAMESDLINAKQQAESSNRSKSEFLANMSHEIRTPMTAILGFTEQLAIDRLSQDEQQDAIATIHRNGKHLLAIINDVLDISKMDAGKFEILRAPCDVMKVLAEVGSLMRVRAIEKGLALDFKYDGPIPEAIQTDELRLRQILLNLLGNAIKFTETGGVTIRASCTHAKQSNPCIEFSVIDTGIGILPEVLPSLFRPFTQADASLTRRFGGTGLGLSIAKRLAEMLGGDIHVDSIPGKGSTFRVSIACGSLTGVRMLAQPDEAAREDVRQFLPPANAQTGVGQLLNCRILLAEDGPDNQRLISHILRKAGAEVEVVENGSLAVQAALKAPGESKPFDVILMDMQMPVMDGYAATRRLRELGYRRPIIAVTAHALESDYAKCVAAGCDDYATKPINRMGLIATIRRNVFGDGEPERMRPTDTAFQTSFQP